MVKYFDDVRKFTKKEKAEIEAFAALGVRDAVAYKNDKGVTRLLACANFPEGCSVPGFRAFSSEGVSVSYEEAGVKDDCTGTEFISWLGDSWTVDDEFVVGAPNAFKAMGNLIGKAYASSARETKAYPEPKDGKKWKSPLKRSKKS